MTPKLGGGGGEALGGGPLRKKLSPDQGIYPDANPIFSQKDNKKFS